MLLHVGPVPIEEALIVGAPGAAMLAASLRLWWRGRTGGRAGPAGFEPRTRR